MSAHPHDVDEAISSHVRLRGVGTHRGLGYRVVAWHGRMGGSPLSFGGLRPAQCVSGTTVHTGDARIFRVRGRITKNILYNEKYKQKNKHDGTHAGRAGANQGARPSERRPGAPPGVVIRADPIYVSLSAWVRV